MAGRCSAAAHSQVSGSFAGHRPKLCHIHLITNIAPPTRPDEMERGPLKYQGLAVFSKSAYILYFGDPAGRHVPAAESVQPVRLLGFDGGSQ
jgi:hypothetical protein